MKLVLILQAILIFQSNADSNVQSIGFNCIAENFTISKSMYKCLIKNASYENFNLKNAKLSSTAFENVNLQNADLRGSTWIRSSCINCNFKGTDLRGSTFFITKFNGSKFDNKTQLSIKTDEALKRGFIYEP